VPDGTGNQKFPAAAEILLTLNDQQKATAAAPQSLPYRVMSMGSEKIPDLKQKALDLSASSTQQASNDASANRPSVKLDETIARSKAVATSSPDESCILFGRGKSCNNHLGNIRMRRIIDRYRDQYQMSVRGEKYKLVRKVYDELVDAGMKFLKPAEGQDGWVEVDIEAAIQKVGHALRSSRGVNNPKAAKSERFPVGNGKLSGANAGPTAGEKLKNSSVAAPTGSVQEQIVGFRGRPSLSTQVSSNLRGGLVQEGAGESLQYSFAAAPNGTLQEQARGLQGLAGLSIPVGRGAAMGDSLLPRDAVGIGGSSVLNPLLSLENYRREMELERLRSWLLGPNSEMTLPRALSALTANELYAMAEQDDQLRQLLLYYLSKKTGSY